MKRRYLVVLVLAVIGLLSAQSASAVVWNNRIPHPITPGKNASEQWLYDALNPFVTPDAVDQNWIKAHQTQQATFLIGPGGDDAQAAASILLEIAGNAGSNVFGIYDPQTLTRLPVFLGSVGPVKTYSILFTPSLGQYAVTVKDDLGNTVSTGTFNTTELGFYLHGADGDFYTQDSLNGYRPQSLILHGNASNLTFIDLDKDGIQDALEPTYEFRDVVVAFEDLRLDGAGTRCDEDYQDMVVFVDFVKAGSGSIPEPASLLIWSVAGGLAAAGAAIRRRRPTRWSDENRQAIVGLIEKGRKG